MKKLRLEIEDLAVETFDVDASLRGKGTVEGKAANYTYTDCGTVDDPCYPQSQEVYGGGFCVAGPNTYTSPAPDDCPCTIPSQGQTVAACAPFTEVQDAETGCA